ncbi:hypothetical protein AV521_35120 [Streptomyces sp. IMTB 2501]|uniref:hypothetical protein n=1 Tax=Streptomyces sp. IMTB 2501 TaxID=1776340 RepID=UPI0009701E31|nr:hypothetical protein [Streptomyces sp. IMTB 2501]OLZ64554.1 hypothetical protein AV521_35120 [Streptomyces sp. IMTB 2501]
MAVDQLPGGVREFASYLDALLARLDQGGGWSGVFWQRDPDGMRACLDGREVPPWDVVEALLEDLAGVYGPAAAAAERERARALHRAALIAYDARPGARDVLVDRLDVMLREQRYAVERQAELNRLLSSPTAPEDAESLSVDLAWAQDDHERATARCAELRGRLTELDRRGVGDVLGVRRGSGSGSVWHESGGPGATERGVTAQVPPRFADTDGEGYVAERGVTAGAPSRFQRADHDRAQWPVSSPSGHAPSHAEFADRPAADPEPRPAGPALTDTLHAAASAPDATPIPHTTPSSGHTAPAVAPQAAPSSPAAAPQTGPPSFPVTAARQGASPSAAVGSRSGGSPAPVRGASGSYVAAPQAAPFSPAAASQAGAPSFPVVAAEQGASTSPAAGSRSGASPAPVRGASGPDSGPPVAPVKPRKRRRGSARFAGMAEDAADPVVVPQAPPEAVPAAQPERRTPRGARFAGAGQPVQPAAGPVEAVDAEAEPAVAGVVERLARLRGEGRSGEAHALLVEVAQWPPGRFPPLADALHRAGLGADWTTLLWEAASLAAEQLVGVADALGTAGREADGAQLLRQGVARPAEQIGAAVLRLTEEGRRREAEALLDACVRVRTAEEAARSVVSDPGRLVPLLLRAAQAVSDERYWDLVHALRVAGHAT